jgi:hypothetical protein
VLVLALAGTALGASVTVRVEGKTRTLLAPTVVQTRTGSITRGGAPSGKCPASCAQGALDAATHHRWGGTWSNSYDEYFVTSILGESYAHSTTYYWSVWINNRYAQAGACDIKLHRGDQLLFAAEGSTTADPIAIKAPSSATVGQTFDVTVVTYNQSGKSKPLAGATVTVAGHSGKTDRHGVVPLTPDSAGTFTLSAFDKGYIRAAPVTVHVSG